MPNTHAPESTATPPAVLVKTVRYGYTHQQPDGNRLVSGRGALPETQPLNIPLDGLPHWLVAAPMAGGSVWVAVLADGRVQAFHVVGDRASTTPVTPARLSPGAPPLLEVRDDGPRLIVGPTGGPSSLTHPIVLDPSAGRLAFLEASGDLVIWERSQVARLAVQGLPDARLLVDQSTRLLLLTDPTATPTLFWAMVWRRPASRCWRHPQISTWPAAS